MIETLDVWLNTSTNFNIFVGVTMIAMIASLCTMYIASRKIGKRDERTSQIYLKISNTTLIVLLMLLSIFISLVGADVVHFRQILIAMIALAIGCGAILMARAAYHKQ